MAEGNFHKLTINLPVAEFEEHRADANERELTMTSLIRTAVGHCAFLDGYASQGFERITLVSPDGTRIIEAPLPQLTGSTAQAE